MPGNVDLAFAKMLLQNLYEFRQDIRRPCGLDVVNVLCPNAVELVGNLVVPNYQLLVIRCRLESKVCISGFRKL